MFAYRLPLVDRLSPDARKRAIGIVVALAIELLILLALLSLGVVPGLRKVEQSLSVFNVLPDAPKSAKASQSRPATAQRKTVTTPPPAPSSAPIPPIRPAHPKPLDQPPGLMSLDKDQYAASDIGKMPAHPAHGDADAGSDSGKDSGAAYGPGAGPGGAPLYNVAWYREPTNAELAGYLPKGAPEGGWADIACRMIENYHVENCRSLGESPVGSGLSRAMREAAWQFLVRPPRRGDKVILGTWVRIHISFSEAGGVDK